MSLAPNGLQQGGRISGSGVDEFKGLDTTLKQWLRSVQYFLYL